MFEFLNAVRGTETLAVLIKMILAVLLGGIIGIEREIKHRPAGFRTHILICLGAAITTLTSEFLYINLQMYTDVARLGAQVIAGIGFIGAGTIIVTKRRRVKGLTTAAGFWVAAIIGLAIGAGYYEGAVTATALVIIAELIFSKFEYKMLDSARDINLFVEYSESECLPALISYFKDEEIKVLDIEITKSASEKHRNPCAIFSLQLNKKNNLETIVSEVTKIKNVVSVEEL